MDNKTRYGFIKDEKGWEEFLKRERIRDYSQVHVPAARMKTWTKAAFLFLRIYIIVMVALIILGFLHVL
ncbi:MAG: hypothetical protein M1160_00155 [Candidatus Marsarchaeota archaeon]|nr:hypothetical protein [Candidatus Marsarchaeota archaeon]MCL5111283.1 hypothetical protein [Candidatus Marsarchaeota archaeon]